jgi:hypothetical protein
MDAKPIDDEEVSQPASRTDGRASLSRRRFTRAGLSGTVLLGSLASKPVLGAVPHECTISGQISGNLSPPVAVCATGRSPADWLGAETWPQPFIKDCAVGVPTPLAEVVSGSSTLVLNQQTAPGGSAACSVTQTQIASAPVAPTSTGSSFTVTPTTTVTPTSDDRATMLQVLDLMVQGQLGDIALGGILVTSLLNSAEKPDSYPVDIPTIVAMGNAAFAGSLYEVAQGQYWDRIRIIEYLESLYPPG